MKRVLVLATACVMSLAAEEARRVSAVAIEGAPPDFPLETRAGEVLDRAKVERDVKALWQSRRPADVRVEEEAEGEQLRVVFRASRGTRGFCGRFRSTRRRRGSTRASSPALRSMSRQCRPSPPRCADNWSILDSSTPRWTPI